jgi:imidazolonepropionase-like amidohydrolase
VIRGNGSYLTPALADLHTHTAEDRELRLFVTEGVTTILNLGLSPRDFVNTGRQRYASGEALGPLVFEAAWVTAPWQSRPGVATRQQARDTVAFAAMIGYDFIKVYWVESDSILEETVRESRRHGLHMVAHVTPGFGLTPVLEAGVSMIAHGEELLRDGVAGDSVRLEQAIQLFLRKGVWLTPNLSAYEAITNSWGNPARVEQYMNAPEAAYLSWERVNRWKRNGYQRQSGSIANNLELIIAATRRMRAAGVPLLLGTDAPVIPGLVPGHAAHEELRLLQGAGLTPFEALATGTRNAGIYITQHVPAAQPFGMIRSGYRADFIVTDANPLEDLNVLRRPAAVVRRGNRLSRAKLDSIKAALRR